MDSLQISTGEKRIPIIRDGKDTGEIVFNPQDTLFMERFYRMCSDIAAKLEDYKVAEKDIEKQFAVIKDVNVFVRERIDYAFGEGLSQKAFGDTVSYDFGIYTQFIDAVKPHIEPVRAQKVARYTNKKPKRVMK